MKRQTFLKKIPQLLSLTGLFLASCQDRVKSNSTNSEQTKTQAKSMKLQSSAFWEGELIPRKYCCDGEDISPPLMWTEVPEETHSFALICDDPDAPVGTFVHWVLYNLPADSRAISEGASVSQSGGIQGKNDFGKLGYGGPCPPSGTHRYFFKLYALDTLLNLKPGAKKADLVKAIEGHILATAELMGRYSRQH